MIRNRRLRRGMALGLVVVGAVLLLMAPSVHYGLAAFLFMRMAAPCAC